MQQENDKNPFSYPIKLYRVEFEAKYSAISILDLIFEEMSEAQYCEEITEVSPNYDCNKDEPIWKYILYFNEIVTSETIYDLANDHIIGKINIFEESQENWVALVQKDFKPKIWADFYVCPNNSKVLPPKDKIILEIDPDCAFGNGEHNTTGTCLEMLCKIKGQKIKPKTILDIGTGTGILAIAASKLFENATIYATEIDANALNVAKKNFHNENLDIQLLSNHTLINEDTKFDLIIANILLNPLLDMAEEIKDLLSDNGLLVLSGFTEKQIPKIKNKYSVQSGFNLAANLISEGWATIMFEKQI